MERADYILIPQGLIRELEVGADGAQRGVVHLAFGKHL